MKVSEGVHDYLCQKSKREHEEMLAKISLEKDKMQLEWDRFELEKQKLAIYEKELKMCFKKVLWLQIKSILETLLGTIST